MKIITQFIYPPIPDRNFDWSAVTDNYEGGDAIGYGKTKQEAISDLQEQLQTNGETLCQQNMNISKR